MDFITLSESAGTFGIKIGLMNKGLYSLLAPRVGSGERILAMAEGLDRKSAGRAPVVITDKAVYLAKYSGIMGGLDFATIPLPKIGGVTVSGGILSSLCFTDGTAAYEVQGLPAPAAQKLVQALRELQALAPHPSEPASEADELRKFKALLDDGTITQEEFNVKKRKILGL